MMNEDTVLLITTIVIQVFNLITTISIAILTFLKNENGVIKRSTCCGSGIEYNEQDNK